MEDKPTSLANLYKELRKVLLSGEEERLRNFFFEHFKEFPLDLKDDFLFLFFEEALERTSSEEEQFLDFVQKFLESLKNLERIKGEVKDKIELLEVKEKIEKLKEEKR